jgi:hypothetical protein
MDEKPGRSRRPVAVEYASGIPADWLCEAFRSFLDLQTIYTPGIKREEFPWRHAWRIARRLVQVRGFGLELAA